MSDQANRLDRIKALREQDYGVAALSPDDVDWLIVQLSEAQARLAEIERQEPVCRVLGEPVWSGVDWRAQVCGLEKFRSNQKLYSAKAPVAPAAQATDARMAAVEQAAALAENVSGPDTARTIRHNGVVMRGDCECTMCKRYNHVEG